MTAIWPLRFRETSNSDLIYADETGAYFSADEKFLERYAAAELSLQDQTFLLNNGYAFANREDVRFTAYAYRWAKRHSVPKNLSYIILVPTLRCNLSCVYCQVSRAAETAKGFDWSEETLLQTLSFLDEVASDEIKIEFQGGEPLLRIDLLERVRSFCRAKFKKSEFVVCTNLQKLGDREWAFLSASDTFVSTSLDGDLATHERQRTQSSEKTREFLENLKLAIKRLGSERVSALPTIDVSNSPDLTTLVDLYESLGIHSIYLRPINFQGFARKSGGGLTDVESWKALYSTFIDTLIDRNFQRETKIEEFYFSHCLRRVLSPGHSGHVDIRNPSLFATDYLLIDYDGQLYPTDEARMQTRIGRIDFSIGHVSDGVDSRKVALMNGHAFNDYDPDCIHCPYQPYCGTDYIDDVSRYGRIDIPRHKTWFCDRHMSVFDKVFELIYSEEPKVQESLAHWAGLGSWPTQLAVRHK